MSNPNNPVNKESLSKASIAGIGMAVGGIILFLVLYVVLTNAGADALTRVVIALCVPPALMAALVGGYFLIKQPQGKKKLPSDSETEDKPAE